MIHHSGTNRAPESSMQANTLVQIHLNVHTWWHLLCVWWNKYSRASLVGLCFWWDCLLSLCYLCFICLCACRKNVHVCLVTCAEQKGKKARHREGSLNISLSRQKMWPIYYYWSLESKGSDNELSFQHVLPVYNESRLQLSKNDVTT